MITATPIVLGPRTFWGKKGVDRFLDFVYAQLGVSAENLKKKLQIYPKYKYVSWKSLIGVSPSSKAEHGGFVSAKQRMFVMKNLQSGNMTVPYARSKALGKSWKTKGKKGTQVLEYLIFSDIGEDPGRRKFVQSRATQHTRMKEIGWQTTSDIAEKEWPKEVKRIERVIVGYKP